MSFLNISNPRTTTVRITSIIIEHTLYSLFVYSVEFVLIRFKQENRTDFWYSSLD